MASKVWRWAWFLLFLFGGLAVLFAGDPPEPGWTTEARVLRVLDGDTVEVEIRRVVRVRLLDCWAPELRGGTPKTKRAARESRESLEDLVAEKSVVLHVPVRTARIQDVFSFGRILGHVWIGDTNASAFQVEAGHATKTKGGR